MATEGELVQLFVYDLSGGLARTFSQMLLGCQLEAIYHTSIVVAGVEHFFGGGINVAAAGTTPFGRPIQVLDLGRTQLPEEVREELLADLSERFTPESYCLWSNNCNNFSNEFAQLLVGTGIPDHITGLPNEVLSTPFGSMLRPMLSGLEQQLGSMRQQAYRPAITQAAAAALAAAPAAGAATEAAAPAVASPPAAEAAAGAGREELEAEEGPALHAAEVEIEAAVAAGMMQEAEAKLHGLELQAPGAGTGAAAAGHTAPAGTADDADKLATELEVEAEFRRLVAQGGVSEHEAQARALEAVAARRRREQQREGA